MFTRNLPLWERAVRAAMGMGLFVAAAVTAVEPLLAWAIGLSGGGLLISSVIGFCPACAMAGRRPPA